jgi:hypothetical protein
MLVGEAQIVNVSGVGMSDENGSSGNERLSSGFLTFGNVRDLVLILLILVVGVRFATADFNIDLKDFSFTDLLSLFLAVSSVALSALFYFKADESSRTFYTHTYKFTKDVSEMLGRIDAGFGEKLRNIDQGYIGLSQKFDRFSIDPSYAASKAEESEAKKAEIQEQEATRDNIIEDLMRRADVAGVEKKELLQRLSSLTRELEQSKAELLEQRRESEQYSRGVQDGFNDFIGPLISKHYPRTAFKAPTQFIRERFGRVLTDSTFNEDAEAYMQQHGLLEGHFLTSQGVDYIRSVLRGLRAL